MVLRSPNTWVYFWEGVLAFPFPPLLYISVCRKNFGFFFCLHRLFTLMSANFIRSLTCHFMFIAQVLVLLGRAVNIFPLTYLLNFFRDHKITPKMMFIMWFSGEWSVLAAYVPLKQGLVRVQCFRGSLKSFYLDISPSWALVRDCTKCLASFGLWQVPVPEAQSFQTSSRSLSRGVSLPVADRFWVQGDRTMLPGYSLPF